MPRFLPYADMDKILSLSKRRGFVFQSSEVYGGLASTWDYGPLGVELKRNVKEAWWRSVILERDDMVGLDAAIFHEQRIHSVVVDTEVGVLKFGMAKPIAIAMGAQYIQLDDLGADKLAQTVRLRLPSSSQSG